MPRYAPPRYAPARRDSRAPACGGSWLAGWPDGAPRAAAYCSPTLTSNSATYAWPRSVATALPATAPPARLAAMTTHTDDQPTPDSHPTQMTTEPMIIYTNGDRPR